MPSSTASVLNPWEGAASGSVEPLWLSKPGAMQCGGRTWVGRVRVAEARDTCSAEPLWLSKANEREWCFTVRFLREDVHSSEVVHELLCERWEKIVTVDVEAHQQC